MLWAQMESLKEKTQWITMAIICPINLIEISFSDDQIYCILKLNMESSRF